MRAEEIDLDKQLWVIPAQRVKNNRAHVVPLSGQAFEIVRHLMHGKRSGALIISPRGKAMTGSNLGNAMDTIRSKVFSTPATPHDLRRTAATLMGRLDVDQMTIARVLNHASTTRATVTGSTYDQHDYVPQKRRALEAINSELQRIIAAEEKHNNVISIAPKRR
jgi:integrase